MTVEWLRVSTRAAVRDIAIKYRKRNERERTETRQGLAAATRGSALLGGGLLGGRLLGLDLSRGVRRVKKRTAAGGLYRSGRGPSLRLLLLRLLLRLVVWEGRFSSKRKVT